MCVCVCVCVCVCLFSLLNWIIFFYYYYQFGPLYGFIDRTASGMTGNRMRESWGDTQQKGQRLGLEPGAAAARTKPLYGGTPAPPTELMGTPLKPDLNLSRLHIGKRKQGSMVGCWFPLYSLFNRSRINQSTCLTCRAGWRVESLPSGYSKAVLCTCCVLLAGSLATVKSAVKIHLMLFWVGGSVNLTRQRQCQIKSQKPQLV